MPIGEWSKNVVNLGVNNSLLRYSSLKLINEPKHLKHISCASRCTFDGRKYDSKQKWNNDSCQCECKKAIKHWVSEEYFAWNLSIKPCKCKQGL